MRTKVFERDNPRKTKVIGEASAVAWLVPRSGKQAGQIFELRGANVIGADAKQCNVVLDEEHVSARHVELTFHDGRWLMKDLGSTNGTRVGSLSVPADQRFEGLQDGDVLTLGKLEVTFKCV